MSRASTVLRALGLLTWAQTVAARLLTRNSSMRPARSNVDRVLVVRLDETIGDTVMFSPFLRELRRSLPAATISLVVNRGRHDMYAHCPYVDEVFATDLRCAATRAVLMRPFNARKLVRHQLSGRAFDIAFVPRVDYDHHAAFIAHASGAPVRVGYDERSTTRKAIVNRGINTLLTHRRIARPHTHEVDRHLDLLDVVGTRPTDSATELWIGNDAQAAADELIDRLGLENFVVLAPTGGHSDLKVWPIERYSEIARQLLADNRMVVTIGSPADRDLVGQLDADVRAAITDLSGQLPVMQTVALLRRSAAFVGADSGMTHVAAALGVPTAAIFGPTCVHTFAPRGPRSVVVRHDLPCGPCHQASNIDRCATCIYDEPQCMALVSSVEVLGRLGEQ